MQTSNLTSCKFCKKNNVVALWCAICRSVSYCSKECQSNDWNNHKMICNENEKFKDFILLSKAMIEKAFLNERFARIFRTIMHLNHAQNLKELTNHHIVAVIETFNYDLVNADNDPLKLEIVFSCTIQRVQPITIKENNNQSHYFRMGYIIGNTKKDPDIFGDYSLFSKDCEEQYDDDKTWLKKYGANIDDLILPINILFSNDFLEIPNVTCIHLNKLLTKDEIHNRVDNIYGQLKYKYGSKGEENLDQL